MDITLLHSAQVEASRAIVGELGGNPQWNTAEEYVTGTGGYKMRVVSRHGSAVNVCPNFSAYPAIVVQDGETVRVKSPVADWADAKAFIEAPAEEVPAPAEVPVYVSKTAFAARFTRAEYEGVLNAAGKRSTDGDLLYPDVAVAVNTIMMLPEEPGVNLRSPQLGGFAQVLTYRRLLTEERAAQILTP